MRNVLSFNKDRVHVLRAIFPFCQIPMSASPFSGLIGAARL